LSPLDLLLNYLFSRPQHALKKCFFILTSLASYDIPAHRKSAGTFSSMPTANTSVTSPPNAAGECSNPFLDMPAKQPHRFSPPRVPSFTVEQVTHVRKPFPVFASTGMLLGSRFIDPVSLAIVMSMQAGLIIPSQQRLLRVFR